MEVLLTGAFGNMGPSKEKAIVPPVDSENLYDTIMAKRMGNPGNV